LEHSSDASPSESLYLKCISWNIEGIKRNHVNLKHFCDQHKPDLVFLSEPQIFHCDVPLLTPHFQGQYALLLNSEETESPNLAIESCRSHGGTMVMWRTELDPYITPLPTASSSFLPILLNIPGYSTSIHVAIYLPTAGRNSEFISALSLLDTFLLEAQVMYSCPVFIRGDANCNPNNHERFALFTHFCSKHGLNSIDFKHPSHHHFTGNGVSDAQLDVLLHQSPNPRAKAQERLSLLVCKLQNPLIDSAHDLVISTCHLHSQPRSNENTSENITARKIINDRIKVKWDRENIPLYNTLLADNLQRLREN
jgi:hypothetical protein